MHILYIFSVWLHIVAAIVWLGGSLFLVLVMMPVLRQPDLRAASPGLMHRVGIRFRTVGWACFALLMVTGVFNLGYRDVDWILLSDPALWRTSFGQQLAIKLALVAIIVVLSLAHDFVIGPRATRVWTDEPGSARALHLRQLAGWLGRLTVVLGLAVVAIAVMLLRGRVW
jgi:putative copper resistance protein D